jgi:hypothetical protein
MSTIVAHVGGKFVSFDELGTIPIPTPTKTFHPIAHDSLAGLIKKFGNDLLKGFRFDSESYVVARDGAQFFGLLTYRNGSDDVGLSIGMRNCHDKSFSAALGCGNKLFVCDNLAFNGEIIIMRKHTLNIWKDIENLAINAIYKAPDTFNGFLADMEKLKQIEYTTDQAYEKIGWLYGHEILSTRQLPIVKENWENTPYPEFAPRTAWSFYNSCTEALKTCAPAVIMEKHRWLHDAILRN